RPPRGDYESSLVRPRDLVTAESLVLAALKRYGLRARRLRPLAAQVVRVDTEDGQTFVLRSRPRSDRVFGDIPLELAWTAALRRDTDIQPPEPDPGLDGTLVQEVAGPQALELYDCMLFRWIPGTELANRLTPENVRRLGVLSARLHEHAATFRPPVELPVRTLDPLFGRGEREVLFSHEHPRFLPPPRQAVFQSVADRFQRTVDALYADAAGRRVIHADLHHENVKIYRGRLRPLDFYEVIWGYPVQDIALSLYDLRFFADSRPHGYAALRDAFALGYGSRLPWPEEHAGQIDTLVAGRRLRQANWVLLHETAPFADKAVVPDPALIVPFFERLEAEFRTLLDAP
ncbi:MAG: Homoserine kinase, partial [Solirubrobacterales bacterium]|nr:Homoserine kinase [Solirubrobacterales bacterium]